MAVHQLTLLNALRHLRAHGPVLPEYGVLWNVRHLTGKDSAVEIRLLQLLRQYYGQEYNSLLPTAHDCIAQHKDPTGWSSSRRIALLNWLIDTLTKEQETHQPWLD